MKTPKADAQLPLTLESGSPVPVRHVPASRVGIGSARGLPTSLAEECLTISGQVVHYVRCPLAGAPTVLLLHGIGGSWKSWAPVLPFLANVDFIALDLPGFGKSSKPPGPLRVESIARLVADFLQALNVRSATVCGTSMGALAAVHLAETAPHLVRRVVLISGHFVTALEIYKNPLKFFFRHPRIALAFVGQVFALGIPLPRVLRRRLLLRSVVSDPDGLSSEVIDALGEATSSRSVFAVNINGIGYDFAEHLRRVRCQLDLIVGSEDQLIPPGDIDRLAKIKTPSSGIVIDGARHSLSVDAPATVGAELVRLAKL
jgi:pimeloyl-ACP methyl ester carboxylesterase